MGARRERECSRGTGGGDTGIGSTGEWLRSRASSNGRGGRWPSCRVAVTPRCRHAEWSAESGGRAVSAVFPNTPARSTEWEQRGVRVVAGSDLRRKRPREGPIRRHGQGIADEKPILRLGLARLVLPDSIALPPGVLGKTFGSRGAGRVAQGGTWGARRGHENATQGATRGRTWTESEAQGEEEHQSTGEGEGGDDRGYASDECQQEGPPGPALVAGPVCRDGAGDRHRHVYEAGDDGG